MEQPLQEDLIFTSASRSATADVREWLGAYLPENTNLSGVQVFPRQLPFGSSIANLTVDLTGMHFSIPTATSILDEPEADEEAGSRLEEEIVRVAHANIHHFTLQASPFTVDELPVTVSVSFTGLPITWIALADGREAWFIDIDRTDHPTRSGSRGRFQVHTPRGDAEKLLVRLIQTLITDLSLTPSHTRVQVQTPSANTVLLRVSTRVRWSFLRLRFGGVLRVRVSSKGSLKIEKLHFRGTSLIIRPFLWYAKRGMPRKTDIGEELMPGAKLRNLKFAAGDYLGVRGEVVMQRRFLSKSKKLSAFQRVHD